MIKILVLKFWIITFSSLNTFFFHLVRPTLILLRFKCLSFGSLSFILLMLSSTSVVFGGSNGTAFNVSAFATPEIKQK